MRGKTPKKPPVKILVPIATSADKQLMTRALYALSAFKDPEIVLFHVVELPSRTVPIEVVSHREEIALADEVLSPIAEWLKEQRCTSRKKIVVARDVAEAIVNEANAEDYAFVIMTKRHPKKGLGGLFHHSVSERVIRETRCMVLTTLTSEPGVLDRQTFSANTK
jgi:nucleotide-binding universal stress UspA family protein